MPEEDEETIPLRGPWLVSLTGLATANYFGLSAEVMMIVTRIIMVLNQDPTQLATCPDEIGGHQFTMGLIDCPGGSLAVKFSLDQQRKEVRVLEIIHPALIMATH